MNRQNTSYARRKALPEFGSECRYASSAFNVSAEGIKQFMALKTFVLQ